VEKLTPFDEINLQKLVDICGYELPTNVQYFTQKDLIEVKTLQKALGRLLFLKHPVYDLSIGAVFNDLKLLHFDFKVTPRR